MDNLPEDKAKKEMPFNNLYLLSGLLHGSNAFWMYAFTVSLMIFGYLTMGFLIAQPFLAILFEKGYSLEQIQQDGNLLFNPDIVNVDKNLILLAQLSLFVLAGIGFYMGLKFVHKKTLTSVLTGFQKFRFKRFLFAFAVWGVLIIVKVIAQYFADPQNFTFDFNITGFLIGLAIMLVLMPIQTGVEEVIFRGYLLQGLSQVFKTGIVPLLITSFLFGLAHMTNPEVHAFGWPIMLLYFISTALFMGGLTLLDEGLELAYGIHFANNFISCILINSRESVLQTHAVINEKDSNPYIEMIVWLCMALATFGVFWKKYRWTNFKLILK